MTNFYEYMKETYSIDELEEIARNGCVSGCAGTLIYYNDTNAIYDKFSDELHEEIGRWMECTGESPDYLAKELGNAVSFKNAVVWFVAELYADDIVQTAEAEATE